MPASDKGLRVEKTDAVSEMSYEEAIEAVRSHGSQRVLVSLADELGNAQGSWFGVLSPKIAHAYEEDIGAINVFEIGTSGLIILSEEAFIGARWNSDSDGQVVAMQNGQMLFTIRPGGPESVIDDMPEAM